MTEETMARVDIGFPDFLQKARELYKDLPRLLVTVSSQGQPNVMTVGPTDYGRKGGADIPRKAHHLPAISMVFPFFTAEYTPTGMAVMTPSKMPAMESSKLAGTRLHMTIRAGFL